MADRTQPEAGAAPAAVAAPPAPAPSAAVEAAPAPLVADAAPAPAAAADAQPQLSTEKPSLLEEFDTAAKAAAKPAEAAKPEGEKPDGEKAAAKPGEPEKAKVEGEKPAEAAKPAEAEKPAEAAAAKVDAPKAEPIKFEFELPATLQANDEKIGVFNTLLNEAGLNAELGKDVGQKLLNLHAEGMQAYVDHVSREQHRVFNETRDGWKKEVLADEQLGGAGYQTSMGAIARMRDMFVTEKDRPAFEQFLRITGAGDHPAFLRMMHNASRLLDEPQADDLPANPKPIPVQPGGRSGRRSLMYDHPRSNPGGRQ